MASLLCSGTVQDTVSESDRVDDDALQCTVQELAHTYPLMDDAQITAYAWDLYRIFVSEGRISAEYMPYSTMYYTDGIWMISFKPEELHGAYDGESYSVLISAVDGHIISFRVDR